MEKQILKAESKAGIKIASKFLDKIDTRSDFHAKVKRDIEYIENELESCTLDSLINCNRTISATYWYLLEQRGFIRITEHDIRLNGYPWNLENLKKIRNCLQNLLLVDSAISSVLEVAPEYLVDKLFGMTTKYT